MRFAVIAKDKHGDSVAVGVFRNFMTASRNATAWNGYVLPLFKEQEFLDRLPSRFQPTPQQMGE